MTREDIEKLVAPISWQDIRLVAGEGKLTRGEVLLTVNAILSNRGRDALARTTEGGRDG